MTLHNCVTPRTNQIIGSLLKTHFVKTKHIKMRRDINEFFVSPEHLQKWSYEVLTRHHQYIYFIFLLVILLKESKSQTALKIGKLMRKC